MAGKEPLTGEKPTEKSPLVAGEEEESEAKRNTKIAIALACVVGVAVFKTQVTAWLFKMEEGSVQGDHAYPTAYSLWSCIVTCLMLIPAFITRPFKAAQWAVPTLPMLPTLSLIVSFTALDLAFTNIALANVDTAVQQCIAATNPFWSIIFETALHGKFQHPFTYFTITAIVAGGVLAVAGSFSVNNSFGIIAAVIAVLASASKYVFTHKAFLSYKKDIGPLALLFWVDLALSPIYLIWTLISGELAQMWQAFLSDQFALWTNTGVAAVGGVRALTQYIALVFVSATSLSTANTLTQILNIAIAIPIQHTTVTATLISGIAMVIIFSCVYTAIKSYKPLLPAVDNFFGCAKPKPPEGERESGATGEKAT